MECAEYLKWVEHLVHCITYNTTILCYCQVVLLLKVYFDMIVFSNEMDTGRISTFQFERDKFIKFFNSLIE